MGIGFVTSEQLLNRYADEIRRQNGLTYDVFKTMVKDLANQFKKQQGRYYVLLSLEEAEHFRGVIHGRRGLPLLPSETNTSAPLSAMVAKTTAALWVLADTSAFMLGASSGFTPLLQHSTVQC